MMRTFLKAKLHQATVTQAELHYDGSCAIDSELLELAGIMPFEQIEIYNITNGERFTTYAILAEPGSKTISMNGAAARKVAVGDRVIICSYAQLTNTEITTLKPSLLYLDEQNNIRRMANAIAPQTAETEAL